MANELYRKLAEKHHLSIGMQLAVRAWLSNVQCVAFNYGRLTDLLGVNRLKDRRVEWFIEDIAPWFQHHQTVYHAYERCDRPLPLFLSTMPLPANEDLSVDYVPPYPFIYLKYDDMVRLKDERAWMGMVAYAAGEKPSAIHTPMTTIPEDGF